MDQGRSYRVVPVGRGPPCRFGPKSNIPRYFGPKPIRLCYRSNLVEDSKRRPQRKTATCPLVFDPNRSTRRTAALQLSSGAPERPPPAGQTSESEASNALQYLYVDPDILSLPKFYHVSLCIK